MEKINSDNTCYSAVWYLLSTTFQTTSTRHNTGVHINAVILWMWNVVGICSGGRKIFVPQEAI
jgi:hypothetical protein